MKRYLMKVINIQNYLQILSEIVLDKQFIIIVLNNLSYFFELIIYDTSYIQNLTFQDIIGMILTKSHHMAI